MCDRDQWSGWQSKFKYNQKNGKCLISLNNLFLKWYIDTLSFFSLQRWTYIPQIFCFISIASSVAIKDTFDRVACWWKRERDINTKILRYIQDYWHWSSLHWHVLISSDCWYANAENRKKCLYSAVKIFYLFLTASWEKYVKVPLRNCCSGQISSFKISS